jgi:hypothetical protein
MFQSTLFDVRNNSLPIANASRARRLGIGGAAFLAILLLAACGTWIEDNIPDGDFQGVATVEWASEDYFVYRPDPNRALSFQPSFWRGTTKRITPRLMYTDGGSIPRFFWNIPGLSPWGFGPAYVIHDYIFLVHRCGINDPDVAQISFDQSAEVLAEVGKALIDLQQIKHDALDAIIWGVRTQYARSLWNAPPDPKDCAMPPKTIAPGPIVARFDIPAIRRRLLRTPGFR